MIMCCQGFVHFLGVLLSCLAECTSTSRFNRPYLGSLPIAIIAAIPWRASRGASSRALGSRGTPPPKSSSPPQKPLPGGVFEDVARCSGLYDLEQVVGVLVHGHHNYACFGHL